MKTLVIKQLYSIIESIIRFYSTYYDKQLEALYATPLSQNDLSIIIDYLDVKQLVSLVCYTGNNPISTQHIS